MLAIDFGTSRTKVAYYDEHQQKPELVKIGSTKSEILPSTFYMREDGKIFIGDEADEMQEKDPAAYITAVKKDIHKDGYLYLGEDRQIERVELVSHLFRHIREFVKKNVPYFRDKDVDECILTVPVIFSPPQRDAIQKAAELGGFKKVLRHIEEPVAAAKAYLFETKHQDIDLVVVCDIGGGTTDFAVVKRHGNLMLPVPEVPTGGVLLGGDDLDERVIEYVEKKDKGREQRQSIWQRIWNWRNSYKSKIRSFKESLSRKSKDEKFDCRVNGKQLSFPRAWLDDCVHQFAQELCDELEKYLKKVHEKLGKDNVPILLAGGSSKLHGLEDKIRAVAGKSEVLTWQNSDYAIVLGAALPDVLFAAGETASALKNVRVELSWTDKDYDLDLSAFLLDANTKVRSDKDIVYYGNTKSACKSVRHSGDDQGKKAEADEEISIALQKLPTEIERIVFVVTLAGQPFAKLNDAEVKLVDTITDEEIARYELKQGKSSSTFIFGELVRNGKQWTFDKLFQRSDETLAVMAKRYGADNFVTKKPVSNGNTLSNNAEADIDSLCTAVITGDIRKIRSLVNAGVDVNGYHQGRTALHQAVTYGRFDVFKALIELGADSELLTNSGQSIKSLAVQYNNRHIVDWVNKNVRSQNHSAYPKTDSRVAIKNVGTQKNTVSVEAEREFQLGEAAYDRKDFVDAVKHYRNAAEQGHAKAQGVLGYCYIAAEGVSFDANKAIEWYRKAAEQGDPNGISGLGLGYLSGAGITQNIIEGFRLTKISADKGSYNGLLVLAMCYALGLGIAKDEKKAFEYVQKAMKCCNKESERASVNAYLTLCYRCGIGTPIDFHRSRECSQKSNLFDEGNNNDDGQAALMSIKVLFEKMLDVSAKQGNPLGQLGLGFLLLTQDKPHDAVEWLRKAAEQGNAEAQSLIGQACLAGEIVPLNQYEGVQWLHKAAGQGHPGAMFALASCYLNGIGVPENANTGLDWLIKSSNLGSQEGMNWELWGQCQEIPLPYDARKRLKELVDAGADINDTNNDGNTILHCLMSHDKVTRADVSHILSLGADVKVQNNVGDTPLHIAVRVHWEYEIIRLLKREGGDALLKNYAGQSPINLARARLWGETEVVKILEGK